MPPSLSLSTHFTCSNYILRDVFNIVYSAMLLLMELLSSFHVNNYRIQKIWRKDDVKLRTFSTLYMQA